MRTMTRTPCHLSSAPNSGATKSQPSFSSAVVDLSSAPNSGATKSHCEARIAYAYL